MYVSANGVNFIKGYERLRLEAYRGEGEQYYTIGYGHYGSDVYAGMTITEAQAVEYLTADLAWACAGVDTVAVTKFPTMNQNQYDALVSYTFNRGVGASDGHNGLRQLIFNSDTLEEVSENFIVYWGTNTDVQDGLLNRRRAEQTLFNTPVSGTPEQSEPTTPTTEQIIENAISWAVGIANDDIHGYDQTHHWGNDYDCASLIIQAYENAGCPVKTNGATYTGNIESVFVATGFESFPYVGGMLLVRGDVLLRSGHTEMYIGNGQNVGAHINELGTVTGGQTGDQTGGEISITNFADSGTWLTVLRLPASYAPDVPITPPEPDIPTIYDLLLETRYPVNRLTDSETTFLQSVHLDDEVRMKHTFNHNKRQVGKNSFGNRLTFDNLLYRIKSVNSNGFLKLSVNDNVGIFKTINPKYIKGANS